MSSLSKQFVVALAVLVVGVLLLTLLVVFKPEPEPDPLVEPPLPLVESFHVQPGEVQITVTSQGTVAPRRQVDLVAEVAGRITGTAAQFAEGGFFESGASLVQVDDQDYRLSLTLAEAEVARAEEQVALEKGRARQAKREWRELGDDAANRLALREPQLASAEASLAAAKANRDIARLKLKRTAISAPFDGRILATHVDLGQYVNVGSRIATVYDTEVVEVRLPLTDRQASLIALPHHFEDAAAVNFPRVVLSAEIGGEEFRWPGQIVRTEATIDPKTRMTYAIAEVRNPFSRKAMGDQPPLAVGMFVEAVIDGRILNDAVAIPRAGLLQGNSVMIIDGDARIAITPVDVVYSDGDSVVVRGIPADSRIVASRVSYPVDGMKVAVDSAGGDGAMISSPTVPDSEATPAGG